MKKVDEAMEGWMDPIASVLSDLFGYLIPADAITMLFCAVFFGLGFAVLLYSKISGRGHKVPSLPMPFLGAVMFAGSLFMFIVELNDAEAEVAQ